MKTYSELLLLPTLEERFDYLKLDGSVGTDTFGFDRYLNQSLYRSQKWRSLRNYVISRDNGNDLGVEGYEIRGRILIHHIEPLTLDDVMSMSGKIFDMDNLICVSHQTHNAIHYGDSALLPKNPIERRPNDTSPWKGGL